MADRRHLVESELKSSFILEISQAEIKLLLQLVLLYQADKPNSELAKIFLTNIRQQTDIPTSRILNNVYTKILEVDLRSNRHLCKLESVPYIPYEEFEKECQD